MRQINFSGAAFASGLIQNKRNEVEAMRMGIDRAQLRRTGRRAVRAQTPMANASVLATLPPVLLSNLVKRVSEMGLTLPSDLGSMEALFVVNNAMGQLNALSTTRKFDSVQEFANLSREDLKSLLPSSAPAPAPAPAPMPADPDLPFLTPVKKEKEGSRSTQKKKAKKKRQKEAKKQQQFVLMDATAKKEQRDYELQIEEGARQRERIEEAKQRQHALHVAEAMGAFGKDGIDRRKLPRENQAGLNSFGNLITSTFGDMGDAFTEFVKQDHAESKSEKKVTRRSSRESVQPDRYSELGFV